METIPHSRRGERLSSRASVDLDAAADEVDRRVLPLREDGEALGLDLDRGLLYEPAVAELVEEYV